jgi:hypothetical protein
MKVAKVVSLIALAALIAGCGAKVLQETDITSNPTANQKTGEACVTNILGVVATGDASINTAAKNGGIEKVATVDTVGKSGFFTSEYCTKVTGK